MARLINIPKVEYLYGLDINPRLWRFMDYEAVLKLKNRLAEERIAYLNKAPMMDRNYTNISDCIKAIQFNNYLLEEVRGK